MEIGAHLRADFTSEDIFWLIRHWDEQIQIKFKFVSCAVFTSTEKFDLHKKKAWTLTGLVLHHTVDAANKKGKK